MVEGARPGLDAPYRNARRVRERSWWGEQGSGVPSPSDREYMHVPNLKHLT